MARKANILTTDEAARFIRVSAKTLRRLAKANRIPFFRVGRQYRFHRAALESLRTQMA